MVDGASVVEIRRTVSNTHKYMPNQMMDAMDSSYSEAPVSPPEGSATEKPPEESVDERNSEEAEILISKDKLPSGTKEGDVCSFTVKKDVGEDYILEYVKEDQEETGEPTKENLDATTANEIAALDSEGD